MRGQCNAHGLEKKQANRRPQTPSSMLFPSRIGISHPFERSKVQRTRSHSTNGSKTSSDRSLRSDTRPSQLFRTTQMETGRAQPLLTARTYCGPSSKARLATSTATLPGDCGSAASGLALLDGKAPRCVALVNLVGRLRDFPCAWPAPGPHGRRDGRGGHGTCG